MADGKKRVFSGVKPTGRLHIGNYVGAISQWVEHQHEHDSVFCIVDLHALTVPEEVAPDALRQNTRDIAALYIACGLDPDVVAIFVQSHVTQHTELTWILNCVTPTGWLERMTQYKALVSRHESVSAGVFDYPVLQAADVLLYDTDLVPVGEDQKQHIELARDIAVRFNNLFGEQFVVPLPVLKSEGARIMGLDDPSAKMSKSLGEGSSRHAIGLLDDPKQIKKAVMSAVTDSEPETLPYESATPGVRNLYTIYCSLSGQSREQAEGRFVGQGYGALKGGVFEAVMETLEPIQKRYGELAEDRSYLDSILIDGANRVRPLAIRVMDRVKRATGLGGGVS